MLLLETLKYLQLAVGPEANETNSNIFKIDLFLRYILSSFAVLFKNVKTLNSLIFQLGEAKDCLTFSSDGKVMAPPDRKSNCTFPGIESI